MAPYSKLRIIAVIIFLAGLGVMLPFAYYGLRNNQAQAAPQQQHLIPAVAPLPVETPTLITGKPIRIQIPAIQVDLTVADGVYNFSTQKWTLSNDTAHYALPTTQPNNEQGNTLIYGHYRKEVFSRLRLLQTGAEATITTDNGYTFRYILKSSEAVTPTDTSIFAYTGPAQLTLQTCSGAWMQNRQLYYFSFESVDKL